MINKFRKLFDTVSGLLKADRRLDEIKINQGLILCELHRQKHSNLLRDYEFKVFSQWGEDGILQFLTSNLLIPNRTFIEFGVEDFFESNCRFLMMKDLWQGYVIDGSPSNIERLKSSYFYWKYPLAAKASFITRENVAELLEESEFDKGVGILSIDVDGVDYHLLKELSAWNAAIIIVEYNSHFGKERAVTVPYDSEFQRTRKHWSNLYWGASLPAYARLLDGRGYALVGVNSVGSNAFFVKRSLLNDVVKEQTVESCFKSSTFREARNEQGELTFKSATASLADINLLPLIDLETNTEFPIAEL